MPEHDEILFNSLIWILICGFTIIVTFHRRSTVGLTAGFLTTFLMNHWLGSALYVFPEQTLYSSSTVAAGLAQSVLGMVAFAFGVVVVAPIFTRRLGRTPSMLPTREPSHDLSPQIRLYALIGMAGYFLNPITFVLPVLSVLGREVAKFAILAACLFVYTKVRSNAKNVWLYAVSLGGIFVLIGIAYSGFASFGSVIAILFLMFYLSLTKLDFKRIIFLILVAYLGVSGFVVYLDNRNEIRGEVWGGAPLETRLETLWNTVAKFELFSPENPRHLWLVDIRLNRNYFVGKAVANLDMGLVDYAQGGTLLDAIIAPIPRVLWPDKPIISGSSAVFTKFTGIPTTANTSTGLGLLLEGYINYGSPGVVVLFLLYGIIIGIFDALARHALDTGNYTTFAVWLLTGFELVDPIDALAGVVGATVSTFLVVNAIFFALKIVRGDHSETHAYPVAPTEFAQPVRFPFEVKDGMASSSTLKTK